MAKKNYYAVKNGRECGVIVRTWMECKKLVDGFKKAKFKGFEFEEEAIAYLDHEYIYQPPITRQPKLFASSGLPKQNKPWGKCLEWKSFTDPFTGIFYKNRCVVKFFATTVGKEYQPNNDTSIPWL